MTSRSTATEATAFAVRYVKQLTSHLGRKLSVDATPSCARIGFDGGECLLTCTAVALELRNVAPHWASLAGMERVVGGHLERFGAREGLAVTWRAGSGDAR